MLGGARSGQFAFVGHQLSYIFGLISLTLFVKGLYYIQGQVLGPQAVVRFNETMTGLRDIPFFVGIFLMVILVPMLWHACYQVRLLFITKTNVFNFKKFDSFLFWLHHASFIPAFIFFAVFSYVFFLKSFFLDVVPDYLWMVHWFEVKWQAWFYGLGFMFLVYYLLSLTYVALIEWGVLVSSRRRRVLQLALAVCLAWALIYHGLILFSLVYHYEAPPLAIDSLLSLVREFLFW